MLLHQPTSTIPPIYLTLGRAYDPYSGRWLSRGPVGEIGGINLYGYVDQYPIVGVDPTGHALIEAITGALIGGVEEYYTGGAEGAPFGVGGGFVSGFIAGGPLAQGLLDGALAGGLTALQAAYDKCSFSDPHVQLAILGNTFGDFLGGAFSGAADDDDETGIGSGIVSAISSGDPNLLGNLFSGL